MAIYVAQTSCPIGYTTVAVDPKGTLVGLVIYPANQAKYGFKAMESMFGEIETDSIGKCSRAIKQVDEYFASKRKKFDMKIELHGTPFQLSVWNELMRIPYGTTTTYGDIAARIGKPKASRAIGQANHNNPIMLVVPCHRVIGSDKKVKGRENGSNIRELLLKHEGAM